MASIVEICNTALAHLGNDNQISSISPPDGSTEAGYCARFFPMARREMIEMSRWAFATKRVTLAQITNNDTSGRWEFAYATPGDLLLGDRIPTRGSLRTILFELENEPFGILRDPLIDEPNAQYYREGNTIYTNEPNATLIYRTDVVDTTKYPAVFTSALGYLLASYLAGPLIRGAEGAQAAQRYRELARNVAGGAATSDANSATSRTWDHTASQLGART